MLAISKILTYLILPPGLFLSLSILIFLLIHYKKTTIGKYLLLFNIILIYLISIEPVKDFLIAPLENQYSAIDFSKNYSDIDYIVFLGGGTISKSPAENNLGSLTGAPLKRAIMASRLYKKYKIPIINSGGRVFTGKEIEAESTIAKRFLKEFSVPANKISIEDNSRNTWENAAEVKKKFSPKKVFLVTSAFHMPRSIYCFTNNDIECIAAPIGYKTNRGSYNFTSFLPNAHFLADSYIALKEYVGYLYYIIRY